MAGPLDVSSIFKRLAEQVAQRAGDARLQRSYETSPIIDAWGRQQRQDFQDRQATADMQERRWLAENPKPTNWRVNATGYTEQMPAAKPERDMGAWFDSDRFRQQDFNPLGPALAAKAEQLKSATDPLADLRAQLESILGKPDIPGQWISPYSQEYLNKVGDRLGQAGAEAQTAFGGLNDDLYNQAAQLLGQRQEANSQAQGQLGGNLANLGLDFNNTDLAKQWQGDAAYLDQVANQNLATQQGTNNVLGQLFSQQGAQLGDAAREGLLTPKQWVGPQSGMSDGDRMKASFLMDQINRMQDQEAASAQAGLDSDLLRQITESASEQYKQTNPLFPELLAKVTNPAVRSALQSAYNTAGGSIVDAIANVQGSLDNPNVNVGIGAGMGRVLNAAAPFLNNSPVGGIFAERFGPAIQQAQNASLQANTQAMQDEINRQVLELLMSISPTFTGVPTELTTNNQSKFNFNALPF
jgi:hypothetical protein